MLAALPGDGGLYIPRQMPCGEQGFKGFSCKAGQTRENRKTENNFQTTMTNQNQLDHAAGCIAASLGLQLGETMPNPDSLALGFENIIWPCWDASGEVAASIHLDCLLTLGTGSIRQYPAAGHTGQLLKQEQLARFSEDLPRPEAIERTRHAFCSWAEQFRPQPTPTAH